MKSSNIISIAPSSKQGSLTSNAAKGGLREQRKTDKAARLKMLRSFMYYFMGD